MILLQSSHSSSEKQITYVFRPDLNQVKCVLRYFVSSLFKFNWQLMKYVEIPYRSKERSPEPFFICLQYTSFRELRYGERWGVWRKVGNESGGKKGPHALALWALLRAFYELLALIEARPVRNAAA